VTDQPPATTRPSGWVGWILFASCLLVLNGLLSVLVGFAAILRDKTYFAANGQVLVFDLRAWGWIHLVIGIALVLVGIYLYRGAGAARVAALIAVAVNMIAHFTTIQTFPWWSVVVIALDVLIVYALVVHGDEMNVDS